MNPEFGKIEIAVLQEDINKYYPGSPAFSIPSLTYYATESKCNASRRNSVNKQSTFTTGSITTIAALNIRVPKDIVRDYKSKIIPKGTRFWVAFIADDQNKPIIIGME